MVDEQFGEYPMKLPNHDLGDYFGVSSHLVSEDLEQTDTPIM